jgi:hypothetical protein
MNIQPGFIYTTTQVGEILGKSRRQVARMCDAGELWTVRWTKHSLVGSHSIRRHGATSCLRGLSVGTAAKLGAHAILFAEVREVALEGGKERPVPDDPAVRARIDSRTSDAWRWHPLDTPLKRP